MQVFHTKEAARQSARALKDALQRRYCVDIKYGQALDLVSVLAGHSDWNSLQASFTPAGVDDKLLPHELAHARDSAGAEYDDESVLVAPTGFALHTPAYPGPCDYLRVVDPAGRETAYWTMDEVAEDPADVLGAMMGALVRGNSAKPCPTPPVRFYEIEVQGHDADSGETAKLGTWRGEAGSRNEAFKLAREARWDERLHCAYQPVLLAEYACSENAFRLSRMAELAGASIPAEAIQKRIDRQGLELAIAELNAEYGLALSVGEYLVFSPRERAFWTNDFGWCDDYCSATGYVGLDADEPDSLIDAVFVRYADAERYRDALARRSGS